MASPRLRPWVFVLLATLLLVYMIAMPYLPWFRPMRHPESFYGSSFFLWVLLVLYWRHPQWKYPYVLGIGVVGSVISSVLCYFLFR